MSLNCNFFYALLSVKYAAYRYLNHGEEIYFSIGEDLFLKIIISVASLLLSLRLKLLYLKLLLKMVRIL